MSLTSHIGQWATLAAPDARERSGRLGGRISVPKKTGRTPPGR
jgi:hypothetical protein